MRKLLITKKRGGLWARLTALMVVLMMTTAQVNAQTVQVDGSSSYTPTQIVNGNFDTRPFEAYKYDGKVYNTWPGIFPKDTYWSEVYPNGINGGWNSSETKLCDGGLFEYVINTEWHGNIWQNGPIIEMNAHNSAVLSQDLATRGDDVILWTIKHAARPNCGGSTQSMRVEIGAPMMNGTTIVRADGISNDINSRIVPSTLATYRSSGVTNPNGVTYGYGKSSELAGLKVYQSYGTGQDAWKDARGVYVIPANQSVTRFAFIAESTEDPACGNLLDDITFSTLVGNLKAVPNNDGSVTVTGYWGDKDTDKKLVVKIGETTLNLTMSDVLEKNFTVTIPSETIGSASTLEVYHQDYEQAKRTVVITNHRHCICGDENCDGTGEGHQMIEWKKWTSTNSLPTEAGNYYLADDVTLTTAYQPVNGVNLCLNGHVVKQTTNGQRVINIASGVTFKLTDCNKTTEHNFKVGSDGLWTLTNDAKTVDYESLNARPETNAVVAVKGGVITGGTLNNCGGAIANYGTFEMYRGNVIGNTARTNHGGGLCSTGTAVFKMYGGRFCGNYTTRNGGGICGNGGAISIESNSVATIYDGEIMFNAADRWGGGIFLRQGNLTIAGGTFSYNLAQNCGGGMMDCDESCTLTITGGTISNNKAQNGASGAIAFESGTINMGGNPVITNNADKDGVSNLRLYNKLINVISDGFNNANIGVTTATAPTSDNPVSVTSNGATSDVQYFKSDKTDYAVIYNGSKVKLAVKGSNVCQIVETGNMFETVAAAITEAGNGQTVQLLQDINLTAVLDIASGKNFTLDLNGHVLKANASTSNKFSVIKNAGTLMITDSNPNATHTGDYAGLPNGGVITGGFGTIAGNIDGGGIYNNGTLTINGGTITGNNATLGGGVYTGSGVLTINGGTIAGNTADNGGAIRNDSGTLNIDGGTITQNTAIVGGGIYNMGQLTITSGTIAGNTASSGGAIRNNGGTLNITGGTITGNHATKSGGGIQSSGSECTLAITGGTITGNTATQFGGGVYYISGTFTVGGKAKISGNTKADGVTASNVYVGTTNGKITLDNSLEAGTEIGIAMKTGTGVFATGATAGTANYFTADNPKTMVEFESESNSLKLTHIPVTYTVNSNADSGTGSLREALYNVLPGDAVVFDLADGQRTITLDTTLTIGIGNLTVDGGEKGVTLTPAATNSNRLASISSVSAVTIQNLTFQGANATQAGAAMQVSSSTDIVLTNCKFLNNNNSIDGGGISCSNANVTVNNGLFAGNTAGSNGGAVYVSASSADYTTQVVLNNCTLTGNNATTNGNAVYAKTNKNMTSTVELNNCIVVNNGDADKKEIYDDILKGTTTITCTNVLGTEANWSGVTTKTGTVAYINGDPLFKDDTHGDYSLAENSQAIDKGDRSKVPATLTTDLAGNPRIIHGKVDAGCYEELPVTFGVTTEEELNTAMSNVQAGDIIQLEADINLTATMNVASDKNFTLDLNGHVLKGSGTTSVVTVASGATFNICDSNPTAVHYFTVGSDGLWTLNTTATSGTPLENLTERPATNAVIAVKGGVITGGDAYYGGGVSVTEGNNATHITMSGGNIIGNKATDSYCSGGGLYLHKMVAFTMTGGNIAGNFANDMGGGVYLKKNSSESDKNTFTMTGGSIVCNVCNGSGGGGVALNGGKDEFTLIDGLIAYNNAPEGGGVTSGGKFTMTGGNITGNEATDAYGYGGGVEEWGSDAGGFTITGGTITENKAAVAGAGVYVWNSDDWNGNLTIGGTAQITGNTMGGNANNVYLSTNKTITASNSTPLTSGAAFGVTTETTPAIGNPVAVTTNNSASVKQYFTSDNGDLIVIEDSNNAVQLAVPIAKVGGEKFTTVQAAIDAAEDGQTVQMLNSTTESVTFTEDKTITLDLNGKTLTSSSGNAITVSDGTLTITDNTGDNGGVTGDIALNGGETTINHGKYNGTITKNNGATLNLIGGKYSFDPTQFLDITYVAKPTGTTPYKYEVMLGGDLIVCTDGTHSFTTLQHAIEFQTEETTITLSKNINECLEIADGKNIILDLKGNIITSNGGGTTITNAGILTVIDSSEGQTGKITGAEGENYGIENNGTLNLNAGEISGNANGVKQNGDMTVGGTAKINGNTTNNLYLPEGNTVAVSDEPALKEGANIYVTTEAEVSVNNPVNVTSNGKDTDMQYFHSDTESFSVIYENNNDATPVVKLAIPTCVVYKGETPVYYSSIGKAVEHATGATTVKMTQNSTEKLTITKGKDITIDLNGRTLRSKNVNIAIDNIGTLTIIDSSEGNGIITGATCGIYNEGTLNLYAGNITENNYGVVEDYGTLTVGGKAVIEGNVSMNLGMPDNKTFTIATDDYAPTTMNIGITTQSAPSSGIDITLTGENVKDYSQHFFGDDSRYSVINTEGNVLKLTNVVKIILTADPENIAEVKIYNANTGAEITDPTHIIYGTMVTIKATSAEQGYAFKGWYHADGTMFSGKYEHTFKATETLNLTAKFTDQVIWVRVKKGN